MDSFKSFPYRSGHHRWMVGCVEATATKCLVLGVDVSQMLSRPIPPPLAVVSILIESIAVECNQKWATREAIAVGLTMSHMAHTLTPPLFRLC